MTTKQLKKHIRKIRAGRFWACVFLLCAIASLSITMTLRDTYYDIWLAPQVKDTEQQVISIQRAIRLKPIQPEGYEKILDIYLSDGVLTEDEHASFQKLLAQYQERINKQTEAFAPLYQQMAFAYLSCYDADAETRLKSAYGYLEIAQTLPGTGDMEKTMIGAWLEVEDYCREYVWLTGVIQEPTEAQINGLVRRMNAMLDAMQHASDADRLAYSNCLAWLVQLHGQQWAEKIGWKDITTLTAKLQQQLTYETTDPASARLQTELQHLLSAQEVD